eukprot:CAMPEP_0201230542 /NCGR_PEP_ID=MMETSP0852-20130820/1956_1 /ASSEMBLY_ACC=CAM_ASM_000632 /TAXON_ID=183588 /ORGANISM="Pseudo-nitzschia fraudulenta, Strain WWA7" /LENGTH=113 /DNA_ID=CAMNT_0047521431 /DNA_START=39 /DNA_END=376 /DNA_ORIENTATION=-
MEGRSNSEKEERTKAEEKKTKGAVGRRRRRGELPKDGMGRQPPGETKESQQRERRDGSGNATEERSKGTDTEERVQRDHKVSGKRGPRDRRGIKRRKPNRRGNMDQDQVIGGR